MSVEPWLTVPEVAALLKLTPQTVYKMIRRGDLPGCKIGRQVRVQRSVLHTWLTALSPRQGDA